MLTQEQKLDMWNLYPFPFSFYIRMKRVQQRPRMSQKPMKSRVRDRFEQLHRKQNP